MPTDIDLIAATRQNSFTAFGVLYVRYYPSAYEFSRELLCGTRGAHELTATAFSRILARLLCGGGPTQQFHAYLRVTIHTMATQRPADHHPETSTDRIIPSPRNSKSNPGHTTPE